jgi:murein DD-endopeptidase MepM/ murein hydrolase activator NlpD
VGTIPAFDFFPVPQSKGIPLKDSYYWRWPANDPSQKPYQRGHHYGIDIHGQIGNAVGVARGGIVAARGDIWGRDYGQHQILVKHRYLWTVFYTFYAHMEDYRVFVGQQIQKGTRIGDIGMEGRTASPHVHMEIHWSPAWEDVVQPETHVPSLLYARLEQVRKAA